MEGNQLEHCCSNKEKWPGPNEASGNGNEKQKVENLWELKFKRFDQMWRLTRRQIGSAPGESQEVALGYTEVIQHAEI